MSIRSEAVTRNKPDEVARAKQDPGPDGEALPEQPESTANSHQGLEIL